MISSYLQQSTESAMAAFPAVDGKGKWHAAMKVTSENFCRGRNTVILDTTVAPIFANTYRAHPIICKTCLRYWQADVKGRLE